MQNANTFNADVFYAELAAVLNAHNVTRDTVLDMEQCEDIGGDLRDVALDKAHINDKAFRGECYALSGTNYNVETITDANAAHYWDAQDEEFVLASDGVCAIGDYTYAHLFLLGDVMWGEEEVTVAQLISTLQIGE